MHECELGCALERAQVAGASHAYRERRKPRRRRAREHRGSCQQRDSTVVTNGKILTVDADFRIVKALAIRDGRIVARGSSAEMARYAGSSTRVIDVQGATVIPGLIDDHFHFTRAADRWRQQARFEGVSSRREALRILADKAASLQPGEWIMVQSGCPRRLPVRWNAGSAARGS